MFADPILIAMSLLKHLIRLERLYADLTKLEEARYIAEVRNIR